MPPEKHAYPHLGAEGGFVNTFMFRLQRVLGPRETPVLEPLPLSRWGPACDQWYVYGQQKGDLALTLLCDGFPLSRGSWASGQVL